MSDKKDAVRKIPPTMWLGKKPSITIFSFENNGGKYLLPICIVAAKEEDKKSAENQLLDGLSRILPSISISMNMNMFFNIPYLEKLKNSQKAIPITAHGLISNNQVNLDSYYEHLEDVVRNNKPDPFITIFGDRATEITQKITGLKYIKNGTTDEFDVELYFEYVQNHLKYEILTLDEFFAKYVPLLETFE